VSVLFIFLDGVGLGADDASSNPFARVPTPTLTSLVGRRLVAPPAPVHDGAGDLHGADRAAALFVTIDATLGVPGLPQSATGQTTLLTGVNAAALAGRHVTAYPTAELRGLLAERSLFAVLRRHNRSVALANVYSPEYFTAVDARQIKVGAVSYAAQAAGVRLRSLDDLRAGRAIFHDLTNARLRSWGHDVRVTTPYAAGERLAAMAKDADLTFFEFFLTDLAAHGRVPISPDATVAMVDELLAGVLANIDRQTTLVIASDHGNLEDGTSTAHTLNPVPVLVVGPGRDAFRHLKSLVDVAPAVLSVLGITAPAGRMVDRAAQPAAEPTS
jgi:2,3-bisphosphoglycerate-independent phosphoglycerate mutase